MRREGINLIEEGGRKGKGMSEMRGRKGGRERGGGGEEGREGRREEGRMGGREGMGEGEGERERRRKEQGCTFAGKGTTTTE